MRTLLSIIFLLIFALIAIIGVLSLIGAILGLTFGAFGLVIGLAFKIAFSPLILIVIVAYAAFRIFGKHPAK